MRIMSLLLLGSTVCCGQRMLILHPPPSPFPSITASCPSHFHTALVFVQRCWILSLILTTSSTNLQRRKLTNCVGTNSLSRLRFQVMRRSTTFVNLPSTLFQSFQSSLERFLFCQQTIDQLTRFFVVLPLFPASPFY
jgi:hypothetical protein